MRYPASTDAGAHDILHVQHGIPKYSLDNPNEEGPSYTMSAPTAIYRMKHLYYNRARRTRASTRISLLIKMRWASSSRSRKRRVLEGASYQLKRGTIPSWPSKAEIPATWGHLAFKYREQSWRCSSGTLGANKRPCEDMPTEAASPN